MYKDKLKKISEFEFELPKSNKMKVPGRLFMSEKLLKDVEESALNQVANVAMLPGVVKYSIGMPDLHVGYGYSIGGVAAFNLKDGIISPGGVGYDINCGVRLLATDIPVKEFMKKRKEILHSIFRAVPSGVGVGGKKYTKEEIIEVLKNGARWAVEQGFGTKEDLEHTEENGRMQVCDPADVSQKAIARGLPQLGTLGAGNHFLEIQKIDKIFDEDTAKQFGLKPNCILLMIHCGSRGLGHQVASDYIREMEKEYGIENLPDRELIYAPIQSELGKNYLSAMNCAVNFAFANRQMIMHHVREQLKQYFPKAQVKLVYDVCHNIAKIEEHEVNGKKEMLCVHRKGATRSFGPGNPDIPKVYREVGQPVLIPGSMGTASYVLVGTKKAEQLTFGSTAHGAGRVESRSQAKREISPEKIEKELKEKDILIETASRKAIVEEAPEAYKDVDEVVRVSHEAEIGNLVARLVPLAVMKG